jgi:hypothetical protein
LCSTGGHACPEAAHPENTATPRRLLLDKLAHDAQHPRVGARACALHSQNNTFPGGVFATSPRTPSTGAAPAAPTRCPWKDYASDSCPSAPSAAGQNTKLQHAVLAAAALHGGTKADLLEEVAWWQTATSGSTPCSRPSPTSTPPPGGEACPYPRHAATWPSFLTTQLHNDPFGTQRKRPLDDRAAGRTAGRRAHSPPQVRHALDSASPHKYALPWVWRTYGSAAMMIVRLLWAVSAQ